MNVPDFRRFLKMTNDKRNENENENEKNDKRFPYISLKRLKLLMISLKA